MENETLRIIVIDENQKRFQMSYKSFCKLLTGKTTREVMAKDYALIEGEGFLIRFIIKTGTGMSMRGMRGDYIINNTQDEVYNHEVAMPMMSSSWILRSL